MVMFRIIFNIFYCILFDCGLDNIWHVNLVSTLVLELGKGGYTRERKGVYSSRLLILQTEILGSVLYVEKRTAYMTISPERDSRGEHSK